MCAILWGWDRGEGAGHVEITSVYVPRPASLAPAPLHPCPVCDSSLHLPLSSTLPFRSRPNSTPPLPMEPLPCVLCPVCAGGHTAPHFVFRASKRPTCPSSPFLGGSVPPAQPVTTGLLPQVPLAPALGWVLHIRVGAGLVQLALSSFFCLLQRNLKTVHGRASSRILGQ